MFGGREILKLIGLYTRYLVFRLFRNKVDINDLRSSSIDLDVDDYYEELTLAEEKMKRDYTNLLTGFLVLIILLLCLFFIPIYL